MAHDLKVCRFCGGPCGIVCRGLGFKQPTPKPKPTVAEAVPAPARAKPRGRPLDSERHLSNEATKPWEALGMSRRTWYRRQQTVRDV